MKRTLKRSRLVGMLAVLLTMSLVTAFGTPVAIADPDADQRGKQQSSQSRAQKCNANQDNGSDEAQPRDCEESENPSDDTAGHDSRGGSDSSPKRSDNGTSSSGNGSNSESKSSKSANTSRGKDSGNSKSNSAESTSEGHSSKGNDSKDDNSKANSQADSQRKSEGQSNSERKSSKADSKSNSERKSSKGNSKADSKGKSERKSSKANSKSKSEGQSNSDRKSSRAESKSNSEGQSNSDRKSSRANSKSKSEGQSNSDRKSSRAESKSNSEGKSNSERKSSKGDNSKSNRDNKGKRGDSRGKDAKTHPPGNNGTVKIDGVPFDDHPDNEPHPSCTFQVDFYNYEEGDLSASVTFTSHPPTNPSGEVVLADSGISIGEDPAMGGTDLDATRTYTLDLSGYEPHHKQGHHIKLTVNAEGSIGADTKHKVFWVDCVGSAAPEDDVDDSVTDDDVDDNVTDDDDSANPIGDDDVDADRDEDEVAPDEGGRDRDEVETAEDSVLGTIIQRGSPSAPTVVQGTTEVAAQQEAQQDTRGAAVLPFTGAGLTAFVVLALALVGTGIAALATRRRRET